MSGTVLISAVEEAVARLESALDELTAAPLTPCTDDELLTVWRRVESVRHRLAPLDHKMVNEVERRGLAYRHGCANTAGFARAVLRLHPGEARERVAAARALGVTSTLSGQELEPVYPATAAAQAAGEVSVRHARVIVEMIEGLPLEVRAEIGRTVETLLLDTARQHDPQTLSGHARDLAAALDQDGRYDETKHRERTRAVTLWRRPDGSGTLQGDVTAECAEHLAVMFDSLAAPTPEVDAIKDPRSAAQRRHDAVLDMLKLVERAKLLPAAGGVSATIVLRMDAEAYATGRGTAVTAHGFPVRADTAKQWAGNEARIIAVLLSRTKGITAYSSSHRIFTEQQRLALIARDQGCSFPGCDVPAPWTEVHHITDYKDTLRTSVDDAALLCRYHHTHHQPMGWTGVMIDGRPHWIPPRWIDGDQAPRRNTLHDRATVHEHALHDHPLRT